MALTAGENKEKLRTKRLIIFAEVVELVYTADLKSAAGTRLAGSNPAFGTNIKYEP